MAMRSTFVARAALVATLTGSLAGCGTATEGPGRIDPEGDWISTVVPAEAGADSPTILATAGDDVLVVAVSDDGVVRSARSEDGDDFETGAPLETGMRHLALAGAVADDDGWFALGSGGTTVVDGDDELAFEVGGVRTDDGLSWSAVPLAGFTGPADINALAGTDGMLIAAGAHRDADDPGMGGFRAAIWISEDGRSWTEVSLPATGGGESSVSDLAVAGDRVLAVGRSGDHGTMWGSEDAGRSWERVAEPRLDDAYAVTRVVARDRTVILSTMGGDGAPQVLRSTDGGGSWTPARTPPPLEDVEGYAPLWAGGGRFFAITSTFQDPWSDPGVCYAEIELCRQDSVVTLYSSVDGDTWTRVDTSGIGAGEDGEVDEVAGTADGRVVAIQVRAAEVRVHTWPAAASLPAAPKPSGPAAVELVEVPEDGDLEPGVRYHAPMFVHCGMDWLHLGDRAWRRSDEGRDVETGAGDAVDPAWPVAGETIFGYATLVDGVVEYSIDDGEVIATYERTRAQPPGCD